MAVTSNYVYAANQILTASIMNVNSTQNFNKLDPYSAARQVAVSTGSGGTALAAYNMDVCELTGGSISAGTSTTYAALAFTSEAIDTNAMHDNVTNNTRITIKQAGIYRVAYSARSANGSTGRIWFKTRVNNTTDYYAREEIGASSTIASVIIQDAFYLNLAANDYIELFWRTGADGTAAIDGIRFSAAFVAPAP